MRRAPFLGIVAGAVLVAAAAIVVGARLRGSRPPILRVVVSTSGGWIEPSETSYYVIREDGKAVAVDAFEIGTKTESAGDGAGDNADVQAYAFDDIAESDAEVYAYAQRIASLVERSRAIENPDLGTLYTIGGRCFFSVLDGAKPASLLMEYLPQQDAIQKLAEFPRRNIVAVQPYS